MEKVSESIEETQDLSKGLISGILKRAKENKKKDAFVVGLYGELGSGKTTFVQGAASALGIKENVLSPTFVIERIYKLKNNKNFDHLIHIDLYRIDNKKEILNLGWAEILSNPKNLVFVEWAEKVKKILPKHTLEVYFRFIDEYTREIRW